MMYQKTPRTIEVDSRHNWGLVPPVLQTSEDGLLRGGREGFVFLSRENAYAIKIFKETDPARVAERRRHILASVQHLLKLPPQIAELYSVPQALVKAVDGQECVGIVMNYYPFPKLEESVRSESAASRVLGKGVNWADFLITAWRAAASVAGLHDAGAAHGDLHYHNILADLQQGKSILLECESLLVQNANRPWVLGLIPFMAPELLTNQKRQPDMETDRHSLAVLVLHCLLFRNPMEPQTEHSDSVDDGVLGVPTEESDRLGFGRDAVFSEHPDNHINRPKGVGDPFWRGPHDRRQACLSYEMLPPLLQRIVQDALIHGLRQPNRRPTASAWRDALAIAAEALSPCDTCQMTVIYPFWKAAEARWCPFCGEPLAKRLVLELKETTYSGPDSFRSLNRVLVLPPGAALTEDMVCRGKVPILSDRDCFLQNIKQGGGRRVGVGYALSLDENTVGLQNTGPYLWEVFRDTASSSIRETFSSGSTSPYVPVEGDRIEFRHSSSDSPEAVLLGHNRTGRIAQVKETP